MKKCSLLTLFLSFNLGALAQNNASVKHDFYDYLKLFLENGVSVILVFFIIWLLIAKPQIIDRITSFGAFGVSVQLDKIKESVDSANKEISSLKSRFDNLSEEYLKTAQQFDPASTAEVRNKLATTLKKQAAAIENINPYLSSLNITSAEADVYAAAIVFQVNPHPKCFNPIVDYLNKITAKNQLNGLTLKTIYRLVMCLENVARTDNDRTERLITEADRDVAINTLSKLSGTERAQDDNSKNGKRGIVARIDRTVRILRK